MYYVYLLKSERNDQLYVGSTKDLKTRLKRHNNGKEFTTKKFLPWKLIYYEAFETEHLARMREKKLKQHGNALRELKQRIGEKIMDLPSTGQSGAGFTLIELLIVVAVLAILALIIFTSVVSSINKANDSKRKADLDRIRVAVEEYEKDHNCYPSQIYSDKTACITDNGIKPYLNPLPCDPVTKQGYSYEPDPATVCKDWFRLYAVLQNTGDPSVIPGIGPSGAFNYYIGSANAPPIYPGGTPTSTPFSTPTSAPTSTPTPSPAPLYYGCISGSCQSVPLDINGNPICGPVFDNPQCNGNDCSSPDAPNCINKPHSPGRP